MKLLSQSLVLLITLMLSAPALAKTEKPCPQEEIVKYVKANASPHGDGSKKHPFPTLAAAALATWDVLIVLPSATALDGGITLTPGQQIIGTCDPTNFTASTLQSIITNSNGVGVTATGDNVIKNIYFKDTHSSAINYDNAANLTVQDCLITGHNQGSVTIPAGSAYAGTLVGGIQGQCSQSGKTLIEHVIIRNNHAGAGIQDLPVSPAHRELLVCKCELAQLNANGIVSNPLGTATNGAFSSVIVKDTYLHDFVANGSGIVGFGVSFQPRNGSVQTALIKNSTFYTINSNNIVGNPIFDTINTASSPELKMEIDSCSFEISSAAAIAITNSNSLKSKILITNSVSNSAATFFQSFILGSGVQRNKLCGNTVTNGTFYTAGTTSLAVKPVEITEIIGNCFTGSIGIRLEPLVGWTFLDITAECNCFFGSGTNSIGFDTTTSFPNPGAFNGLIDAHENTFSGFTTDIVDNGSTVSYLVSKNFWGTPTQTCTTTSTCGASQICENGKCVGPVVSLPTASPLFMGYIDASHPLTESITCPCDCRFPATATPAPL